MRLALAGMLVVALAAPAGALAAPAIHAHRGGSLVAGEARFPENTMPAFRNSAREGYVLELDVKLTADRVPVVIHDDTLDRTTNCAGPVSARTRAELGACRTDALGSPGNGLQSKVVPPSVPVPTLAEVLAFARAEGASLNLEIKNLPNDNDFDPTDGYANRVMDEVVKSGFPRRRLIAQSFYPRNLDVARTRLPGVQTSLLTLSQTNEGGPAVAAAGGYDWVSPGGVVSKSYVDGAHGRGLRVVPYTLNAPAEVRAAAGAGVDALISDDPEMARLTLGLARPQLASDELAPRVELSAPTFASNRSRTRRFRVRWRGTDRGSGIAAYKLEVARQGLFRGRWRRVAHRTSGRSASFRGRPGTSYVFRLRARDRYGNLSRYAYDQTDVPVDARSRRVKRSRGWRTVRRRQAWGGTLLRTRQRGAELAFAFEGTRVALIARRSRHGARIRVSAGGRTRVVSLRRRPRGYRRAVFVSPRLPPGEHVLRVRKLSGGPADIDAFAVRTGPPLRKR